MIPWSWIIAVGLPALALVGLTLWLRSARRERDRWRALAITRAAALKDSEERAAQERAALLERIGQWETAAGRVRTALTAETSDAQRLRDDLASCMAYSTPDRVHDWVTRVLAPPGPTAAGGGGPGPAALPQGRGVAADPVPGPGRGLAVVDDR